MCPIYCYKCNKCGMKEDQLREINERDQDEECPICDDGILKRVMSAIARTADKWRFDR